MGQKPVFLPPYCGDEVKSSAERKMFEVLQELELKNAVILHSLGLPKHNSKVYGEIDFVVVCELGIACLEIKGGRVECRKGQWFFTDRYGNEIKKNESPFAQVTGNMFSLKNIIKARFRNNVYFNSILFASGVVFPDIEFTSKGEEIIPEIIYDALSPDITGYLNNVFEYWRDQQRSIPSTLSIHDIKEIVDYLRGEFLFQPSLGSRIEEVERYLLRSTEDQKAVIKGLAGNRHLLIKGGAGTGKTFCALDHAKREVENGHKVLYLTFNKNLANRLNQETESRDGLKIINIHGLFGDLVPIDLNVLNQDNKVYFEEIMPEQCYQWLKAMPLAELINIQYDVLVIDEAQDMLRANYLYCLDLLLRGGLEKGKWAIFYDEKQNLFNPQFEEGLEILELYQNTKFSLFTNCRNTRQIAGFNSKISSYESKELLREDGEEVSVINYEKKENFDNSLNSLMKYLKKEKVKMEDVVFLSPKKYENSQLKPAMDKQGGMNEINENKANQRNQPIYATIQGFKGLDSKVVVLVDMNKIFAQNFSKYMYIAVSRARSKLFVMVDEKVNKERMDNLT
ncbi:MAG: NERD domain-containing protein [Eubacteriaceae bacterium]